MLRIDRICIWILIFGLIVMIPSLQYLKFIDELCAALFAALAAVDCIVNKAWRKYSLMWILIAIMAFYAIYSLTLDYNIPKAIFMDLVIELKPFIPFIVILAARPKLTTADKQLISIVSIANCSICALALFTRSNPIIEAVIFHVTYGGIIIFLSAILYLYCNIDKTGRLKNNADKVVLLMLTAGLACTRAKYYGLFILCIYFLLIYKPANTKRLSVMHIASLIAVGGLVLAVTWNKIEYYFLVGNGDTFDPEVIESFARPVLYVTGGMILIDHIPFGTGLASFATYPSSATVSYSNVYYEYGIDKVHGLAPIPNFDFICDSFYPSLAQFGIIGVILFVCFWRYVYKFLLVLIRTDSAKHKYTFIIGVLIICFILIESTSSTTLTQSCGMMAMCLLGIICGEGKTLRDGTVPTTLKIH